MTLFIGIDPGETTGLARWDSSWSIDKIEWLQVPAISIAPALKSFILPGSNVACERYVIGANTVKKSRKPTDTTMKIIGVVEDTCTSNDASLTMQASGDAKSFGHDRTMRRLGWYIRSHRHATDAARHMLLLIARRDVATFTRLINDTEDHGQSNDR